MTTRNERDPSDVEPDACQQVTLNMHIQLSHNTGSLTPAANDRIETRRRHEPAEPVRFEAAAAVDSALERTPDVRPEVVERARRLVESPHYPPPETIRRIANLLALHLNPE